MEIDFAIVYFGLTRCLKKTIKSHTEHIYNLFDRNNLTYKTFMHTWNTNDSTQNIWETTIAEKIDVEEYKVLNPDFYKMDNEDDFLKCVNMDNYFYKHIWETQRESGEWLPRLVSNFVCMLESQKRAFEMVRENVAAGYKFKFIMFVRPDFLFFEDLPLKSILENNDAYQAISRGNFEGINDTFAIMNYTYACIYGNRINELAEFRKNNGRITAEKYAKFIVDKYNMKLHLIDFNYTINRP
jgi:hypothetical protein